MVPRMPTLTVIGSLTETFMLCNNWIMKTDSFTASELATHSASEFDRCMLCYDLDHQDTGTPEASLTLFLVMGSSA